MAIAPNSKFFIFSNIPLDNTYNHTLWFDNLSEQKTYFSSTSPNLKHVLNNQTYQRVESGVLRVQVPIASLYDCNYCAFQNTNYGTKWFYAFITSCEYVNDVTSEIYYEIDVMQTYLKDVDLLSCFVEREHSATDNIGDNIIPEPFEIQDYFTDGDQKSYLFDEYTVAMLTPYKYTETGFQIEYNPRFISNTPMLMNNIVYKGTNLSEALEVCASDIISLRNVGHDDEIVSIYLVPLKMLDSAVPIDRDLTGHRYTLPTSASTTEVDFGYTWVTLGNYGRPKNNKLLTSPYNKFTITTFSDEKDYAFEYFKDSNGNSTSCKFRIYGNFNPNSSFKAVPLNYKGDATNFDEGIVLTDFPLVPYNSDNFAAWLSRNKTRLCLQGIGTVFNAMSGVAQGKALVESGSQMLTPKTHTLSKKGAEMMAKGYAMQDESKVINPLKDITGVLGEVLGATELGVTPQGSTDGSLEIAMGKKDFNFLHKYINPNYAKMIDDFFDMFGYATKQIKVPNRNVRPHWTYTKTVGCIVKGRAPQDAIKRICNIYDNGITFWKNAGEVGNYFLNNNI